MQKTLESWAALASHYIGDCFDAMRSCVEPETSQMDPYVRFVSSLLFVDCHLSSESSLILVRAGKEWDADIINRSIMEGTVKFVYLLLGNSEEVREKAVEYWETLSDNGAARHSERAKAFLKDVGDPDSSQWLPFKGLVLADEEIEELRAGTNREQRQRLEQKWSFSGITQQFVASESKGLRLLAHLAHGYGMSSHLMHKDGDGVGMVWERSIRPPDRRDAAKLGHSSRIVSDICSFTALRAHFLLRHCGGEPSVLSGLQEKYDVLFSDLQVAGQKFTATEYGTR